MTQPDSHDERTIWGPPADPTGALPETGTPPTLAADPVTYAGPHQTYAGPHQTYAEPHQTYIEPPAHAAPTLVTGTSPVPDHATPAAAPGWPRRRIAIVAVVAALVVGAIVTTVVLLVGGPSVDDVAGTWAQRQSLAGMSLDQTLVVSGDRFTYTLGVTSGGDDTAIIGGGLLGGLLGGSGGMTAGVRCAGKVDVDGDEFLLASDSGPCGTLHGTLRGKTLTLRGAGDGSDSVDLVRQ